MDSKRQVLGISLENHTIQKISSYQQWFDSLFLPLHHLVMMLCFNVCQFPAFSHHRSAADNDRPPLRSRRFAVSAHPRRRRPPRRSPWVKHRPWGKCDWARFTKFTRELSKWTYIESKKMPQGHKGSPNKLYFQGPIRTSFLDTGERNIDQTVMVDSGFISHNELHCKRWIYIAAMYGYVILFFSMQFDVWACVYHRFMIDDCKRSTIFEPFWTTKTGEEELPEVSEKPPIFAGIIDYLS